MAETDKKVIVDLNAKILTLKCELDKHSAKLDLSLKENDEYKTQICEYRGIFWFILKRCYQIIHTKNYFLKQNKKRILLELWIWIKV
jgi:hypothetical protein